MAHQRKVMAGPLVALALLAPLARAAPPLAAAPAVRLPELPPLHVRHPGLFDEQGCALVPLGNGETLRNCPAPTAPRVRGRARAMRPPAGVAAADTEWRDLLGYRGPLYATAAPSGRVVMLEDTVGVGAGVRWTAQGLVRNETTDTVRDVVVHGRLLDRAGSPVGDVAAAVAVQNLRPGEPGPFALAADAAPSVVDRVEWTVDWTRASGGADGTRATQIVLLHVYPYGTRERLARPLPGTIPAYGDPPAPPYPQIVYGSVRNWGDHPIARPRVVGLWLDANLRGVRLATGAVYADGATGAPRPLLAPGETADFVLLSREVSSEEAEGAPLQLVVWETPS